MVSMFGFNPNDPTEDTESAIDAAVEPDSVCFNPNDPTEDTESPLQRGRCSRHQVFQPQRSD